MKKIIFLLVDSLMPTILEDCMQDKLVPALQFLREQGHYWSECVTVFPTMTASVDSSLLTGVYPNVHRVPGLIWYEPNEKEIINYINGWKCIWKQGIDTCAQHVIYNLNEKHLSKQVTTLFEELDHRGFTSASINTIIHRGPKKYQVKLPFLLDMATKFRMQGEISGPDVLTLGRFVENDLYKELPMQFRSFRGFYGINDHYAIHVTKKLIETNQQPDFMLVYLPDNDHKVHKTNPDHAQTALIQVDQRIQDLLNTFGSWEEALNQCIFIITSDHGQTRVGNGREFVIDLDQILQPFNGLPLGEKAQDHDLVLCNNERMAYIYPLKLAKQEKIIQQLALDARIDLIAIKKEKGVLVKEGGSGREVYFAPDGPYVDKYGSVWTISGCTSIIDLDLQPGKVHYHDYPDVLARLYGALYAQDVPMIVITARPRYEFLSRYYPLHIDGGCHGSLHKYDSMIPLMIAGTDHTLQRPPRLVDLKDYVLQLFEHKTEVDAFQS